MSNIIDFKEKWDEKHEHLHQLWLADERKKLIAELIADPSPPICLLKWLKK